MSYWRQHVSSVVSFLCKKWKTFLSVRFGCKNTWTKRTICICARITVAVKRRKAEGLSRFDSRQEHWTSRSCQRPELPDATFVWYTTDGWNTILSGPGETRNWPCYLKHTFLVAPPPTVFHNCTHEWPKFNTVFQNFLKMLGECMSKFSHNFWTVFFKIITPCFLVSGYRYLNHEDEGDVSSKGY
jgi:hypothetical protein